ncbi:hypothetical protein J4211_06190 [Candidatus Woesearchaeota archaeon]|nr:hypothetical protein [Candidatus Woesearchaeota archaeon]
MTTILIFGDSIAYGAWDAQGGWVARLRKLVDKRNADPKDDFYCLVYNLGVSGDTTADVLQRMNAEINAREKDDLILVFSIGGNDAVYIPSKKSNKVAPAEFEKNINKIIKQAKKYTNHSLFTGIIPMDESKTHPVTPEETELALEKLVPKKHWGVINDTLVRHGKTTCLPLSPLCSKCPVYKYCKRVGVTHHR